GAYQPNDLYAAVERVYPGDRADGAVRGNFNQLQILKKKHPHLKTLISVGGWTLSGPFSDVAATEQLRNKFARSCVAFVRKYDFDGVDGGWEQVTGFHAPLFASPKDATKDETIRKQFNVDAAVQAYLKAKVPPEKLNVGVPFYGRGWSGVGKDNNGLFQKAAKEPPKGTW